MFDLNRYEQIVAPLDVSDLDFSTFEEEPLAPEVLACLRYMHDVEAHTACYLRNLLNTRAHHDPEITSFLTLWNFEEYWHSEAIGRVLAAHGEPAGRTRIASMRERLGWRITASPLLWMGFSAVTRNFLAVHMTFGVVNEWTTQAAYARLRSLNDHPVLDELLRRIMKQEGRHIDFYRHGAVSRLDGNPRAQRVTRFMLRRMWSPVGSKAMPKDETVRLIRTLFGGEEGRVFADRVDRRVDQLPGLDGLALMQGPLALAA